MPSYTATAPGKVILFGEHSVVYGHAAIAVPVTQVRARAVVMADIHGAPSSVLIQAPDINLEARLEELGEIHPLAAVVRLTAEALGIPHIPSCTVRVTSTIPVAAGMGSGAAVSVAILRALSAYLGHPLTDEQVCDLAFQVEKIHHGTPSGIDNTVITYCQPVYFVHNKPMDVFLIRTPFTIVVGDTGISSATSSVVGDVRRAWQADPGRYEALFDSAGRIAVAARKAIEEGEVDRLGAMMDANQEVLQEMGVSCEDLERLIRAARAAGAMGAKLSGGGRGGNMIALVKPEQADQVVEALHQAGATRSVVTEVKST